MALQSKKCGYNGSQWGKNSQEQLMREKNLQCIKTNVVSNL